MLLKLRDLNEYPIILVYGEPGCGKTRLLLEGPGPMSIHGFDRQPEGWWAPYLDKGIEYQHYTPVKQEHPHKGQTEKQMIEHIKNANSELLENFFQQLERDAHNKRFNTLAIDGATRIAEINKLAQFGRACQIMQYDYSGLRVTLRRICELAYAEQKCVIITAELKDEYRGGKPTGKLVADGDKCYGFGVNTIIHLTRDDDDGFHAEFTKATLNTNLYGVTLDNDEITYQNILTLIKEA